VIIDSGSELAVEEPFYIGSTLFAQTGGADRVGGVEITLEDKDVVALDSMLFDRAAVRAAGLKADSAVISLLDAVEIPVDEELIPDLIELVILHTNDIHGRVMGERDEIGFARIASIAEYLRERTNVLLLDAGDAVHGTTFANLTEGASIIELMNAVGYDAMAAGNHDFNFGLERLLELTEMADFPILSANVTWKDDGSQVLAGHTLFDVEGVQVGVFGLTSQETYYKTHPRNVEDVDIGDYVPAAKASVQELKDSGADVIIALVHIGLDELELSRADYAYAVEALQGIDLIVDGHSHSVFPEGMQVEDTYIVQAGEHTKHLGTVTMQFTEDELVSVEPMLLSRADVEELEVEPHPMVAGLIDDLLAEQEEITAQVIAEVDKTLVGERADVRTRMTNLGRMITRSMLEISDADVALMNGGGIRSSISAGEVTLGDVISVLPFGNIVTVIEVTGADLYEMMEHGLSRLPEQHGGYPHIAGMQAVVNRHAEPGERVFRLRIGNRAVDPDATYQLVTNDFLAAGGDAYTMLEDKPVLAEFGTLDEVFAEYLQEHYPIQ